MFGMAGETQFDLRFNLFGVPIRIHPIFWASSAMLCWNPDQLELVLLGVVCIFVSVLIHELGHALVFRYYGWPSEIVLYFFCGYATATRLSKWRQIWSLAAGPIAGMTFAVLVYIAMILTMDYAPTMFDRFPALSFVFMMLLFGGIIVNIMNLIPVLPLDGGQIMATLIAHHGPPGRKGRILTLQISIATAAAIALWSAYCLNTGRELIPMAFYSFLPERHAFYLHRLQPDPTFEMIFFGILGAQNLIEYNNIKSW